MARYLTEEDRDFIQSVLDQADDPGNRKAKSDSEDAYGNALQDDMGIRVHIVYPAHGKRYTQYHRTLGDWSGKTLVASRLEPATGNTPEDWAGEGDLIGDANTPVRMDQSPIDDSYSTSQHEQHSQLTTAYVEFFCRDNASVLDDHPTVNDNRVFMPEGDEWVTINATTQFGGWGFNTKIDQKQACTHFWFRGDKQLWNIRRSGLRNYIYPVIRVRGGGFVPLATPEEPDHFFGLSSTWGSLPFVAGIKVHQDFISHSNNGLNDVTVGGYKFGMSWRVLPVEFDGRHRLRIARMSRYDWDDLDPDPHLDTNPYYREDVYPYWIVNRMTKNMPTFPNSFCIFFADMAHSTKSSAIAGVYNTGGVARSSNIWNFYDALRENVVIASECPLFVY